MRGRGSWLLSSGVHPTQEEGRGGGHAGRLGLRYSGNLQLVFQNLRLQKGLANKW